ncbi:MAG: DUF3137 domain-containing protein [Lachnospiraceae bacterium]|jgi:hypothetical protein|nr:DUF3137 domain-containing protein [Lachnospiraceae bacterium]
MSNKEDQSVTTDLSDEQLTGKLKELKKWTLANKIAVPICAILGFAGLLAFGINEIWPGVIAVLIITIVLVIVLRNIGRKKVLKLKDLMGSALTLPILREVFEVQEYRPNDHIPGEVVRTAGLVYWGEIIKRRFVESNTLISGSDFVKGTYKGVNILYSDVLLQKEELVTNDEGKEEIKRETAFQGQWLICDFGKELAARLRLYERKGGTKWNRTNDLSKSDVETENMAFNKKYRIVTNDGHTAFYLLTPHFMEQLLAADEAADSTTLFSFVDGKVHIALYSGRDSFELKGVKLNDIENVRQKFRGELKQITGLMDELLKNDKMFKKS